MKKIAIVLTIGFALVPPLHPQDERQMQREACMGACMRERANADLQRQEVIALERETAHAIELGDATFFRRVYSDDFSGVLSRGQNVDKASLIAVVQAPGIKYESFRASDTKVRLYRDIAVATSTWSIRGGLKGRRMASNIRQLLVSLYGPGAHPLVPPNTTSRPH